MGLPIRTMPGSSSPAELAPLGLPGSEHRRIEMRNELYRTSEQG
jgi:hypothetical protein